MDKPNQGVILLVGPEGGLSDHEINLAENQELQPADVRSKSITD